MSGSRPQLLRHEVRTALKENRFLLPLVPLVTLVAVCAYHEWIPIRFDGPAAFLANLLKTVWPAVAWIPPFLMLKRPDLRNPDAAWRTLPVSKEIVFGSRLLVVGVVTVALPALMVGLASVIAGDGMAGSQTALMAAYQWGYLWLGALAAYALRGYRGLALIPGIAVALVLSALVFWCIKSFDTQFTASVATHEHRRVFGLLLPWLVLAIVGPLAAILQLRKPDTKPRPWRWIAGAFLAFPAVVMLQSFIGDSGRNLLSLATRLPAIETTLAYNPTASGFFGLASNASIPLPPGFNAYRTDVAGGFESDFASGDWKSRSGTGFIGKGDSERLRFMIFPKEPEMNIMPPDFGPVPYKTCSLGHWMSFGSALGLTHPTVQGTKPAASAVQWHPIATEPRRFRLAIDFFESKLPKKERFKEKSGETVTISAGIPVHEALPTKMIFKAKLNTLDFRYGGRGEMPKDFSLKVLTKTGDRSIFLMFNKHLPMGAAGDVFGNALGKTRRNPSVYGVNFVGLLLNRRLEQTVFLNGSSQSHNSDWLPVERTTMQLYLPSTFPALARDRLLPKAWMDEAELIVLESENGPATTLPVKLSFKVPEAK